MRTLWRVGSLFGRLSGRHWLLVRCADLGGWRNGRGRCQPADPLSSDVGDHVCRRHDRQPARLFRSLAQAQGRAVNELHHRSSWQGSPRWTGKPGLWLPRPDQGLRAVDPGQRPAVVFDLLLVNLQAGLLDPEERRGQRLDGQPAGAGGAIGANAESIAPVNTTCDEACVIGPVENIEVLGLDLRLNRAGSLNSRMPERGTLPLAGTANVRASHGRWVGLFPARGEDRQPGDLDHRKKYRQRHFLIVDRNPKRNEADRRPDGRNLSEGWLQLDRADFFVFQAGAPRCRKRVKIKGLILQVKNHVKVNGSSQIVVTNLCCVDTSAKKASTA